MEWTRGEFLLTDAHDRADVRCIFELLEKTYWGVRRPYETVEKMVQHSLWLTLLHGGSQIGFGRVVTDYTVFSWVADIVIDDVFRGQGLGKWMMTCITEHPCLMSTQMVLQTRDSHTFYEKFGFSQSSKLMSTAVVGL
jgi:GNAT superfamily N-acetyltransferase